MGYNISVKVQNKELQNKMIDFMKANYESLGNMTGPPEKRHGNKIAIEYSSCLHGEERLYVYSVVRWMALKVGTLKSKFNKTSVNPSVFDPPVPFMTYDSYERWPILVCASEEEAEAKWPKSLLWCCTDRLGVYLGERTSEFAILAMTEVIFTDEKKFALFEAAMKELGPIPRGDNEKRTEWLEKKRVIQAGLCESEIRAILEKIRTKIGRLDELWTA